MHITFNTTCGGTVALGGGWEGAGTGIGLALTRELVKLLDGKITVQSTEGKGTEFTITLPIRREAPVEKAKNAFSLNEYAAAPVPEHSGESDEISSAYKDEERPLVLIVEDNRDVVAYIKSCLSGIYQLETAYNGREGIEIAIEIIPDIIISDIMMPEKDGMELCRTLKNDFRTSHIPVILLTAKADIDSKLLGLEQGADAYLAKPFNREELLIRIKKLIELRRQLQALYANPGQSDIQNRPVSPKEDAFFRQIKEILEANLSNEDFGIMQLCRAMGISRAQLHRKLKALANRSTSQYIRAYRLYRAKDLIKTTSLNISEVAYEVGFRNAAYFSTSFLEEFGISPSELRN